MANAQGFSNELVAAVAPNWAPPPNYLNQNDMNIIIINAQGLPTNCVYALMLSHPLLRPWLTFRTFVFFIFYVGIGTLGRPYQHFTEALNGVSLQGTIFFAKLGCQLMRHFQAPGRKCAMIRHVFYVLSWFGWRVDIIVIRTAISPTLARDIETGLILAYGGRNAHLTNQNVGWGPSYFALYNSPTYLRYAIQQLYFAYHHYRLQMPGHVTNMFICG